jgi:hypothetical protein
MWLRVTQLGKLVLVNSDRVTSVYEYDGVDPGVQSTLMFSPESGAVLPQEIGVDQTVSDFSAALSAVPVGGA